MKRILLLLLTCLFLQSSSFAASFDCAKAFSYVDKNICSDKKLSLSDDYLNVLYNQISPDNKSVVAAQKKWLVMRNQCADVICIQKAYRDRLVEVRQQNEQLLAAKKVKLVDAKKIISTLNGEWKRDSSDQYSGALLTITKASPRNFHFQLNANNGSNVGEIDNNAVFRGNDALFVQHENLESQAEKIPCVVLFQFTANSIRVVTNTACENLAGMGVAFDGNFLKNIKHKVSTLAEYGILENAAQEKKLTSLAGKDYQLFTEACGNLVEEKQSYEPSAKVREASARGSAIGCITMWNTNQIWAAVIDEKTHSVKYFTDDAQYRNKLPKSISEWVNRMNENNKENPYKVVFSGSKK